MEHGRLEALEAESGPIWLRSSSAPRCRKCRKVVAFLFSLGALPALKVTMTNFAAADRNRVELASRFESVADDDHEGAWNCDPGEDSTT